MFKLGFCKSHINNFSAKGTHINMLNAKKCKHLKKNEKCLQRGGKKKNKKNKIHTISVYFDIFALKVK